MPRLNDIEQTYMNRLAAFADKHPDYGSAHDIWKAINQSDPDQQRHIHTRWLLERALSSDKDKCILWEDIAAGASSKAHDILKRFLSIRPLLPHDQRNLYQYGNLSDVTAVIRPLEHVKTPGELKAEERERVDRETVILYEQDGYKVLVPLSEEASCYWGRGTEWCTAATKSRNAFQSYHEDGPVVICILPDGKKMQFHKDSPPMDENDAELRDVTDPVLVQLCVYFGQLGSISETLRYRELCLVAVENHGAALQHVPEHLCDREMCLEAIKQNSFSSIQYVPSAFKDKEMYLEAVKQNGVALRRVPKELRDKEMCLEAVKQEGHLLLSVPNEFIDISFFLAFIVPKGNSQNPEKHLCDSDIYRKAVKENGLFLKYIPEELRDKDMCLEAVRQDGWALKFVPDVLRDRNICMTAITQNGLTLRNVPERHHNGAIFLTAVKNNGFALQYVPKEHRDRDICLAAVTQNGFSLQCVPEELRTEDICLEAVKNDKLALFFASTKMQECIKTILHNEKKQLTQSPQPDWMETSLLDEITKHLQKSCSFSTPSPI